ncbi:hypothetical protein NA57DRAFT_73695 [Rhizodiscina lignyota]|uniref:Heterokaryon incompatibility domain-containing protein n=1 Tax=Rhizodiscina lignyota TaxID=1504668 RepID=A0A9P4M919_9PEZI|nr:hypothetical protein NA57DRAFT_73695 [Rhizodiscina lignyota]
MEDIYSKASLVTAVLLPTAEKLNVRKEYDELFGPHLTEYILGTDHAQEKGQIQNILYKDAVAWQAMHVLEDVSLSYFQTESDPIAMYWKFAPQRYSFRLKALREFLSNPWFERMWVLQEIALAHSFRFMYGDITIPWQRVLEVTQVTTRNSGLAGPLFLSTDKIGHRKALSAACETFPTICRIRNAIRDDENRSLATILLQCRNFKSTNPEDKLFAIPEKLLKPTESKNMTMETLLTNAAECIVAEGDTARMLAVAGIDSNGSSTLSRVLPSWVPNWPVTQTKTCLSFRNEGIDYHAGGLEPMQARIQDQNLFVFGYSFDKV